MRSPCVPSSPASSAFSEAVSFMQGPFPARRLQRVSPNVHQWRKENLIIRGDCRLPGTATGRSYAALRPPIAGRMREGLSENQQQA